MKKSNILSLMLSIVLVSNSYADWGQVTPTTTPYSPQGQWVIPEQQTQGGTPGQQTQWVIPGQQTQWVIPGQPQPNVNPQWNPMQKTQNWIKHEENVITRDINKLNQYAQKNTPGTDGTGTYKPFGADGTGTYKPPTPGTDTNPTPGTDTNPTPGTNDGSSSSFTKLQAEIADAQAKNKDLTTMAKVKKGQKVDLELFQKQLSALQTVMTSINTAAAGLPQKPTDQPTKKAITAIKVLNKKLVTFELVPFYTHITQYKSDMKAWTPAIKTLSKAKKSNDATALAAAKTAIKTVYESLNTGLIQAKTDLTALGNSTDGQNPANVTDTLTKTATKGTHTHASKGNAALSKATKILTASQKSLDKMVANAVKVEPSLADILKPTSTKS